MKIKFNWGFGIVVCFILFGIGTIAMVYISMTAHVDLVTDDYYEKELRYEDHIRLVRSADALEKPVMMELSGSSLNLTYPDIGSPEKYTGTIFFFRPSDKRGDFSREVRLDSLHAQSFPLSDFTSGLWRVKITWNVEDGKYYSEMPVVIY